MKDLYEYLEQEHPEILNKFLFTEGKITINPGDKVIYVDESGEGGIYYYHGVSPKKRFADYFILSKQAKKPGIFIWYNERLEYIKNMQYLIPFDSILGQNYLKKHYHFDGTDK